MENRHGLVVDAVCTEADGYAEREAALELLGDRRGTLGGELRKVPEAGGEGVARGMETVPSLAPLAYELSFRRRDGANPARRGRFEHDAPSPPASGCACRPSSAAC
jgi:hypothetical protein